MKSHLICARLVPNLVLCLSVEVPAEGCKFHGCKYTTGCFLISPCVLGVTGAKKVSQLAPKPIWGPMFFGRV